MSENLIAALWQVVAIVVTAVIAAIIAIWGIVSQRSITRRSLTLSHLATIDADLDMIEARKLFINEASKPSGLTPWVDPGKEQTDECQAIRLVLNNFELVATGIQFGALDYDLYRRYERGTVIRYWYAAAPFIYSLRRQTGSRSVYHEFEELARWFETGRRPPKRGFRLRKLL